LAQRHHPAEILQEVAHAARHEAQDLRLRRFRRLPRPRARAMRRATGADHRQRQPQRRKARMQRAQAHGFQTDGILRRRTSPQTWQWPVKNDPVHGTVVANVASTGMRGLSGPSS
jgi:hypothetical protein